MINARKVVVATRKLPDAAEQMLKSEFTARLNKSDRAYTTNELINLAAGADGLLVTVTDRIDANLIEALPSSLRIIANFGVGYEHIDIDTARSRGVIVTNTPDVLTEATAEIAVLLMLGAARRAGEGHMLVMQDAWPGWSPTFMMGHGITGKTLGILGMGRIGQAVAHRARGFNMEIHYHNRKRLPPDREQGAHYHDSTDSLFAVSTFLSIHAASTPQTKAIVNARTIDLLPKGAILINTARGDLVDDAAVIAALKNGQLAAAGFDVFAGEPNPHPDYRRAPNVFLLPHLGSATIETRNNMGFLAIENLRAFFAGKEPPNRIA